MLKKKNVLIILISLFFVFIFLIIGTLYTYLNILPKFVETDFFQKSLTKIVKEQLDLDLTFSNPKLKTYLNPKLDFEIKSLTLKKNALELVNLEDFKILISFDKLLKKEITLKEINAKNLIVKIDELLNNLKLENNQQTKQDFKIDYFNTDIKLDNLELSYKQKNNSKIEVFLKDVELINEETFRNLGFNFEAIITKNNLEYVDIVSSTIDEIKLFDDEILIQNLKVLINNSDLKLNAKFNPDKISLNAKSKSFYLEDIFKIINSDFIIENGQTMLKPLVNPKGCVSFDVNMNNNVLDGVIFANNTKAEIKDLTNIPISIQKGKILIKKDYINFIDLIGFYGKNKENNLKIYGKIKDYYKTFDSDISIDTVVSNEFFKDYLSKLINNTIFYTSKPFKTKIIYKAKNNIMDITWLAKIPKGVNFGVDKEKSALSDYDRAIKGDFNINKDILEIKNINYYIAQDINKNSKIKPIIVISGKTNLSGKIDNLGFSFNRKMPCEFLNIFTKEKTFKKGTIQGNLYVAYKNNIPYLKTNLEIEKTLIPSQRVFIKSAKLISDDENINVLAQGGFKRIRFDFNGKIKNELQAPFIIRNLKLDIDKIDVKKFLTSLNNEQNQHINYEKTESENDIKDDNFMFNTNLIVIEDADFSLKEGSYGELTFSDIKAQMTLDKNGILELQSNKFNIAEGISTLRVKSDLKNLKHSVRLGVKDVNSDLMAKVLLNLHKEISGKASGLIELYTDKSLKLNGDIKFIVQDGTIGKIGLVEYVLKIASLFRNPVVMVNPATIADIVSIPEGKFDKITGSLSIKDNNVRSMNIKSYSSTLSALIRGQYNLERHDASIRIYTKFSNDKKTMFDFLRNISLNRLANKVQMNTRNDANYYSSELVDLPSIDVPDDKAQIFITQVEGDVENNNFISILKKIK